ncbi:hypothetical protein HJD18_03980 [Thermoleophilia bacterium SCSIO 60948]|nr:hypothetical protein HJD18_03980 [Thermoleophilia bacterium SCSIO 60948]
MDGLLGFLPNLLGFLAILIIGFFVARIVKAAVGKLLEKVGLDRTLHQSDAGKYVEQVSPGSKPSKLIGSVVFWFIFIFALSAAVGALEIPAVTTFMNQVLAYLPNVIVAVLIFVAAAAIAGGVAALVHKTMGDTPTGRVVRAAVPVFVMGIAIFMILTQLQIAEQIVLITYAALMATATLGLGLAFGLGGRGVAADMLNNAYDKGRDQSDQVQRDVERGRDRAESRVEQERSQRSSGGGPATGSLGSA